jgi:NADH dehydrogenase
MQTTSRSSRPKIIIIGGGFAGLHTAQNLAGLDAEITLIDRRNFHLFQPLLYQVATGGLSPANIAAPLRAILKDQKNTTVVLGEVTAIGVEAKTVHLEDGSEYKYDYLVVASGSSHNYFGKNEWAVHAPGLKTIEDATRIRTKVLSAFEQAELESNPEKRSELLRFVVIGGGPTGVELAGALGEISRQTLRDNFRHIDPASAEILLIEAGPRIIEQYPPDLSEKATVSLERLGVRVISNARVVDIKEDEISIKSADTIKQIKTHCVLWAAGVQASPLGAMITSQVGASTDRAGRVIVGPDLRIPGRNDIFIVGDLALIKQDGTQVPGVAPAAIQSGKYVADVIAHELSGRDTPMVPFHYRDKGSMATIGRSMAVAQVGRFKFSGFFAWILWLVIHVLYLIEFTNRLLVIVQWGWNYITRNRSARLITEYKE